MEVPRPALRREGEVKNPARRSPGGRRMETTVHFFRDHHFYFNFWNFGTLQLLWLAGALVRSHTLVIDSRVRKETRSWKKSESFVFVPKILCSFLCSCHGVYFSVLEKGSVDPKVLVQSKINSDVRRAFYCSKDKGENITLLSHMTLTSNILM